MSRDMVFQEHKFPFLSIACALQPISVTTSPSPSTMLKLKKTGNDMITCHLDNRQKTFRRTTVFHDNKEAWNGVVSLNEDRTNSAQNSDVLLNEDWVCYWEWWRF